MRRTNLVSLGLVLASVAAFVVGGYLAATENSAATAVLVSAAISAMTAVGVYSMKNRTRADLNLAAIRQRAAGRAQETGQQQSPAIHAPTAQQRPEDLELGAGGNLTDSDITRADLNLAANRHNAAGMAPVQRSPAIRFNHAPTAQQTQDDNSEHGASGNSADSDGEIEEEYFDANHPHPDPQRSRTAVTSLQRNSPHSETQV